MFCKRDEIHSKIRKIYPDLIVQKDKDYIKSGVSFILSFISAIFIIGFIVGLLNEILFKKPSGMVIFASILALIVYLLSKDSKEENYFFDAILIASQTLMFFGIVGFLKPFDPNNLNLLIVLIEIAYIYIFKNQSSQIYASIIATISFDSFLKSISLGDISLALILIIFLVLIKILVDSKRFEAPVYGVTLSLIFLSFSHYLKTKSNIYFLEAIISLITIIYLTQFESRLSKKESFFIIFAFFPLILLSIWIKGFGVFFILFIIGFFFAISRLFIIGVLGMIVSISIWYYNLEITLTQKSFLMMGSGLILIFIGILISRFYEGEKR
jgi:hypothetical protein